MKKSALILFLTLLPFMAKAQNTQNSEDGKKIDKEKLKARIICPKYTEQSGANTNTRPLWAPDVSK